MVQFKDLPSEIVTEVFRSIPLSDFYFSLDVYAPIIDPYVCVITDCLDSKLSKLFRNVIQITDFQSKFDDLTGISFIIFHIVKISKTLDGENYVLLQNIYKTLKERKKDTIFLIEKLNTSDDINFIYEDHDLRPIEDSIILNFSRLFNTHPCSNLLVMKNIISSQLLPWNLDTFIDEFDTSNVNPKTLEYLFRNLVIEDLSNIIVQSDDFFRQKLASSLMNDDEAEVVEEMIIFKGIKAATIIFPMDVQEPFQEKVHGRVFDVVKNNVDSIKALEIFDTRLHYDINHVCYHLTLDSLLKFVPRLLEKLTRLEIVFEYKAVLNNLSFPKLQSFEVCYARGYAGNFSDSPLTVNNVYMPELNYLESVFESSNLDLSFATRITSGHILQFGNYGNDFGNYDNDFDKMELYHTTERTEDDKMCHFFSTILDFELSRKIRILKLDSPILVIFNTIVDKRRDFCFDNLEELRISCFIYSKMDQLLNQPFVDVFTHKHLYAVLKKLDIVIISGGDPIQVTTLDNDNLPNLEHLCIKASWECFNSIKGLQVISLPKLSFTNLRVLKLEDVILPNFTDLDLPNVKEISLKDVYEDELFSGLTIMGELSNLQAIKLEYTGRKTILRKKSSPEFQLELDRTITIYLDRCIRSLPVIIMEKAVYDRLLNFKYSKKEVALSLV